ncbi:MAG: ABC transporter permease [Actinomycetaceae bacterium]|nr:ABC transporter permease [Arcanobacterium sp.]MDD7687328.1 ABC transporter permease [Actinomycetaceae bacterium]MDY5274097.1 methionine ABC transporter permease [Arcanobacterium sp.]
MSEWLVSIFPNLAKRMPEFWQATVDTLVMVGISGAISFVLGMFFAVLLTITRPEGISENALIFQVIDKVVNFFRSVPFIILVILLMPLSRLIMGTAIGVAGAIVPLVFGCVPFFTRQVENALADVPDGLIEAAEAMGLSTGDIIWRVYLREGIPALVRGGTVTIISLIGLTAMAGAVGAGGLGDFAIRYGKDLNQNDVTWGTVIMLVLMVTIVQVIGTAIARRAKH